MWWDPGSFAIGLVLGEIVGLFLAALLQDWGNRVPDADFQPTELGQRPEKEA